MCTELRTAAREACALICNNLSSTTSTGSYFQSIYLPFIIVVSPTVGPNQVLARVNQRMNMQSNPPATTFPKARSLMQ